MPSPDLFARSKLSAECLSAWQISQLSLGLLASEALTRARDHVAGCAACRARLADEEAEAAAARYQRPPEALLRAVRDRRPAAPRWWQRGSWVSGLAVAAAAAALVIAVRRPDAPAVRTKGALDLSLTVMRDGRIWGDQLPAAAPAGLQPGDRLRLRVHGAADGWLRLEGWEDGQWAPYFEGALPANGWLPLGVTLTPDGETRLRLSACPAKPDSHELDTLVRGGTCQQRTFSLL